MKFNLSILAMIFAAAVIAAPLAQPEKEGFAYKRVAEKEGFYVRFHEWSLRTPANL